MTRIKLVLHQKGDTIIEVMIALAVLGLAISISYATANRSLLAARQAQENTQAASLLQSQIELLRTLRKETDPAKDIYAPGKYCLDPNDSNKRKPDTDPACKDINELYDITIEYDTSGSEFALIARWDNVRGEGDDSVTLVYRMYKE